MSNESTVLIVDDEPLGRTALQSLLFKEGYRLEFAVDGPSALKIASEIVPDLILLDVMMPGMDGYEVCRKLRDVPNLAEIPVLLVTALDDSQSRLSGIESGADDFITKPFDRVELRARIRTILRLNRYRRLVVERQKYEFLFEKSPNGLVIMDGSGQLQEANPAARRLLETLVEMSPHAPNLFRVVPRQDVANLKALLETAKTAPLASREFFTRTLKGGPVWIEVQVSLCPAFGPDAYLMAILDRTSERTLEAQLRHSQKLEAVGHLAGAIAREFQNLLGTIVSSSHIAQAILPEGDSVRNDLQKILDASEKATRITQTLLGFCRKSAPTHLDLNLNQILVEADPLLRPLMGEEIEYQVKTDPNLGKFRGDRNLIEQLLVILALNSRDAMPARGTFTLQTQTLEEVPPVDPEHPDAQPHRWVRLIVSDTGVGMSREVLSHLFEPFFTTKTGGKGTGLGLATVYGIVNQGAGRIQVESESGKGTRILIDWPLVDDQASHKGKTGVSPW